jgi:hypothetical protein
MHKLIFLIFLLSIIFSCKKEKVDLIKNDSSQEEQNISAMELVNGNYINSSYSLTLTSVPDIAIYEFQSDEEFPDALVHINLVDNMIGTVGVIIVRPWSNVNSLALSDTGFKISNENAKKTENIKKQWNGIETIVIKYEFENMSTAVIIIAYISPKYSNWFEKSFIFTENGVDTISSNAEIETIKKNLSNYKKIEKPGDIADQPIILYQDQNDNIVKIEVSYFNEIGGTFIEYFMPSGGFPVLVTETNSNGENDIILSYYYYGGEIFKVIDSKGNILDLNDKATIIRSEEFIKDVEKFKKL